MAIESGRVPIKLLAFAQAADHLGTREQMVDCTPEDTCRAIARKLAPNMPLEKMRVALDEEYVDWETPVGRASEMAISPPVSGG
jgi:molybdopterin converting factor small subunit